jgi:hypothetical protein
MKVDLDKNRVLLNLVYGLTQILGIYIRHISPQDGIICCYFDLIIFEYFAVKDYQHMNKFMTNNCQVYTFVQNEKSARFNNVKSSVLST